MEITKLTKRNHYEAITEQLARLITEGRFKVGDRLPSTKAMSEQFGVGRSTTREALSALKAMGLIEIRQGGGCRVVSQTPRDPALPGLEALRLNQTQLLELLEARQALEVSNASIAARKRTDADLAELDGLLAEMEDAIGDDIEGERTDLAFHQLLARATHNAIMVQLLDTILAQMEMAIREIRRVELYASRAIAEQLYRDHLAIAEAVRTGDREAAAASMRRHLERVEGILRKYI
ncbi:FadR family transcriptional regulator [Paenibacillus sp. IB182496]|uniref:FadR family transcriptional regulator n=1 Tax=Paenibacillus sabuli TaxID=2772509 RepID=A0A927BU89_9BACL|nr:FadR/GntR family transcriptional regulator [Paenibacillus sabuli]MBD2845629.1 FadR family transcriptional regulator [Paenibacillus sabuli]